MHRTPYWSDYLTKPDEQVEQPTITKPQSLVASEPVLSKNVPQKPHAPTESGQSGNFQSDGRRNTGRRNNSISTNNLAGRSIGNRRAQIKPRHAPTAPTPETPALTNYLHHLGEQVMTEHASQQRDTPAEPHVTRNYQNDGRRNATRRNNSISPINLAARSIGNRRTRSNLQHAPTAPPSTHETHSLTYFLRNLGEQVVTEHASPERDTTVEPQLTSSDRNEGRTNAGRGKNAVLPDESASPSIGDNSARAEQAMQPVTRTITHPYWTVWLSWLVMHIKRPNSSQRLSGTEAHPSETNAYSHSGMTLGIWGYYFAAKLTLFWMNLISFHPLENLALAGLILFFSASRFLRRIKNALIFVSALSLLYYDSWLPPIARVIARAPSLADFKLIYLLELTTRFISLPVIAILLGVSLVYWIVSYRLRSGALVIACLAALSLFEYQLPNWITNPSSTAEQTTSADKPKPNLDQIAQAFFAHEAQRSVSLPAPHDDAVPFDLIFIQVCSLSWDDLRYAGLDQHPLWQRFDILLTNFNSATSYSGPAAIRLLRATCGQPEHSSMYSTTHDNCYLLNSLSNNGYETNFAMNHDGKFDDLLGQIKSYGQVAAPPLPLNGLKITQRSFNNSPVYDDLTVLNRWLETRQESVSPRVTLYYHTGSLHDGNFLLGTESLPNTLQTYRKRLLTFLDEMEQFMQSLEKSGRRAVVVMVPEHGGAVRGDSRQISGLREIPTPAITLVPVGIKVIGENIQREGDALLIDQPTSYLAISHIVARMLENSPFTKSTFAPSGYVADLPSTQFIAQTENAIVIEENGRFHLKIGSQSWNDYTEFNISTNR
ncbi:MAG: cellulose biosynthesis protein BcsG [Gallionella sp.]|nr:cellulose biosynthesis protein BcsG [Gallionella sp.]